MTSELDKDIQDTQATTDILKSAIEIVGGDRAHWYGDKLTNHEDIAQLWNAYLRRSHKLKRLLEPSDVAILMCLLKIARMMSQRTQEDSFIDAAAYAAIAGELRVREHKEDMMAEAVDRERDNVEDVS